MVIFPAIDIRGGKCVRLFKGDFAQETVFSDKPEDMAVKWQQQCGYSCRAGWGHPDYGEYR